MTSAAIGSALSTVIERAERQRHLPRERRAAKNKAAMRALQVLNRDVRPNSDVQAEGERWMVSTIQNLNESLPVFGTSRGDRVISHEGNCPTSIFYFKFGQDMQSSMWSLYRALFVQSAPGRGEIRDLKGDAKLR
jgi:hypothetical protein